MADAGFGQFHAGGRNYGYATRQNLTGMTGVPAGRASPPISRQQQQAHHQHQQLQYGQQQHQSSQLGGMEIPSPSQTPDPQSPPSHHNYNGLYTAPTNYNINGSAAGNSAFASAFSASVNQQRFNIPAGASQKYHQDQTQAIGGHQHSYSGGAGMGASSLNPGHLGPIGTNMVGAGTDPETHLSNGAMSDSKLKFYQQQLQLWQNSRGSASPHHHARSAALLSKGGNAVFSGTANPTSYQAPQGVFRPQGIADENSEIIAEDGQVVRQEWKSLDFGGQGLKQLTPSVFQYKFLDKLYLNNNKLASLPEAIKELKYLSFLDISLNALHALPEWVGLLSFLKELLLFDNHIEALPPQLGTLARLEVIGLQGNPLPEEIMTKFNESGTRGLIVHLREICPDPDPPQPRNFIDVTNEPDDSSTFTLLCYNILCERAATPASYLYVSTANLDWNRRKQLVLEEILERTPDIVCLQECDQGSWEDYFQPELSKVGYKSSFQPKSKSRYIHNQQEHKMVDGCATFWNKSKFFLLEKAVIDIVSSANKNEELTREADHWNRLANRDNLALVNFLQNYETGARLIVLNAHLYWDPLFADVKLIQTGIIMGELEGIAEKWSKMGSKTPLPDSYPGDSIDGALTTPAAPHVKYSDGQSIPLVLCGDFNSTKTSGVYQLLAGGSVPGNHLDLAGRSYGPFTRSGIQQPFSLKSAYVMLETLQGPPHPKHGFRSTGDEVLPFTNYTPNFTEVIDYIWYGASTLDVRGLLGKIDEEYVSKVVAFPNRHFPSDHISLMAKFSVRARKEQKDLPPPEFGNGQSGSHSNNPSRASARDSRP